MSAPVKIKGKFAGQLLVQLQFSPRDQTYRVVVSEWGEGRNGWNWFKPTDHVIHNDFMKLDHARVYEGRHARTKALRYYAKAKGEQAYRHAANQEKQASGESWEVLAR